jgi:hypothetical protein
MKIITKNKDYYDFLQGIYGVDEKIILDRTKYPTIHFKDLIFFNYLYITLFVGDYMVCFAINKEGKIFHKKEDFLNSKDFIEKTYFVYDKETIYHVGEKRDTCIHFKEGIKFIGEKSPCYNFNFPIVFQTSEIRFNKDRDYSPNLCLSDFNLGKIIPPHDIYLMIQEFLSKQLTPKENSKSTLTNDEKILSHGFDLKESFRNIKKK